MIGTGIGGVTDPARPGRHPGGEGRAPGLPADHADAHAERSGRLVGLEFGARAGVHTTVSACASGAEAIAVGLDLIQLGRADVVVVGGTEACIHPLPIAGFAQMRAMSTRNDEPERASRPFDKGRDGFVLGEGAGVLVLERADHAAARGARRTRLLAGAGITVGRLRHRRAGPQGAAQRRAIALALRDAGVDAADVVHVNAHATSTPVGDVARGGRDRRAARRPRPVVTATKSMTGHLLGAAGAIESIATVLAVTHDVVPPTINLDDPDDDVRSTSPARPREMPVPVASTTRSASAVTTWPCSFRKV